MSYVFLLFMTFLRKILVGHADVQLIDAFRVRRYKSFKDREAICKELDVGAIRVDMMPEPEQFELKSE